MKRKRCFAVAVAFGALVLPAGAADAAVIELGAGAPPALSSCPNDPCSVITRVTGYQGRSQTKLNPFVVPTRGKIVAFTVSLHNLAPNQIEGFETDPRYGVLGEPTIRLVIMRKGRKRKRRLDFRVLRRSKVYRLGPYIGSAPTFALDEPLLVGKGQIVGVSTESWAPILVVGPQTTPLPGTNWWRASRPKNTCEDVVQRAQQDELNSLKTWGCTYKRGRLLYSATFIPDPKPTRPDEGDAEEEPSSRR